MPLSVPAEMQVTQTARYRQMLADYQLLAREQLICGTQVHVGVEDRDEAVIAREPGVALSAYAAGDFGQFPVLVRRFGHRLFKRSDSGVAALADDRAGRARGVGGRIRTAGRGPGRQRGDHRYRHGLFRRPSSRVRPPHWNCGSATAARRSTSIVLIAGLFRALVEREIAALRSGHTRHRDLGAAGPGGAVARGAVRPGGRPG